MERHFYSVHGLEDLVLLKKCPCYPKWYTNSVNPCENPNSVFWSNRKSNPQIYMEPQRTHVAKMMLIKKNKAGGLIFLDFKTYYKAAVTQTVY